MNAATLPRLVTNLHSLEKKAVLQFTKQAIADYGDTIEHISLYSAGRRNSRGFEEVEILILTTEDDDQFEDRILDVVADVVVDTGVYLTVRTFSREAFESFSAMKLPIVSQIRDTAVALFDAR